MSHVRNHKKPAVLVYHFFTRRWLYCSLCAQASSSHCRAILFSPVTNPIHPMHKKLMTLSFQFCIFCRPSLCFFQIICIWEQEHPSLWGEQVASELGKESGCAILRHLPERGLPPRVVQPGFRRSMVPVTFCFHHSLNRRQERVFKMQNEKLARRKKASSGTRRLSQAKWCTAMAMRT